MSRIEEMRKRMINDCCYSMNDINRICEIEQEFDDLCLSISEELEQNGLPSHGTDYELQCEDARKYYDMLLNEIDSKY